MSRIEIVSAKNGMVVHVHDVEESGTWVYEYSEEPDSVARARVLLQIIEDHYYDALQTKHDGGLVLEVKKKGRHYEDPVCEEER